MDCSTSTSSPSACRKPLSPVNGSKRDDWSDDAIPCAISDGSPCSTPQAPWKPSNGSRTPHRRHPHQGNSNGTNLHLKPTHEGTTATGGCPRKGLPGSPRSKLSPRSMAPRSIRRATAYITATIFAGMATYLYLVSSVLMGSTQTHNKSNQNDNQNNNNVLLPSQGAFDIMSRNMPKPPLRNAAGNTEWQQPILEQQTFKEVRARPRVLVMDTMLPSRWLSKKISSFAVPLHKIANDDQEEESPASDLVADAMSAHSNTTKSSLATNSTSEDTGGTNAEDKGGAFEDESELQDKCDPAEPWQVEARPSCNIFHEVDMRPSETPLLFLGQGWFRSAWRLDSPDTSVVIKMLRLEREFLDEYYELHRRDAVAMEHLTFSPFVMDVYGYCGQSAINEIAEFRDGINALEQLDRRMRGQHNDAVMVLKLRLAVGVSVGLYHVHYGIPGMPWDHNFTARPTMAHYDINPRNIAIVTGGKPKLNDFNIAEFLHYPKGNATTDSCGFPARLHEPWWRAPEEMNVTSNKNLVNEKVDIYALGAVLYHILTTHSPRGKMKKERMEEVRQLVINGIAPPLMEPWASSNSPMVQAFKDAMKLCFQADPQKRGTTKEVATILYRALQNAPTMQGEDFHPHDALVKTDEHHHNHHHHDKKKNHDAKHHHNHGGHHH